VLRKWVREFGFDPVQGLEASGNSQSDRQRLDRMYDIVHDAIPTHRSRGDPGRVAEIVQVVGLDQRAIGVGDLVGSGCIGAGHDTVVALMKLIAENGIGEKIGKVVEQIERALDRKAR